MFDLLLSISEFGTKLVAGLSGLIFAIIIVVCVFVSKKTDSKPSYPDTKIGKNDDATKTNDKKAKKNKKGKKDKKAESDDTSQTEQTNDTSQTEQTDDTSEDGDKVTVIKDEDIK